MTSLLFIALFLCRCDDGERNEHAITNHQKHRGNGHRQEAINRGLRQRPVANQQSQCRDAEQQIVYPRIGHCCAAADFPLTFCAHLLVSPS